MDDFRTTRTVSWLALIISLIALVLGFVSWNRDDALNINGNGDSGNATTTARGTFTDLRLELARLKAASQLALLSDNTNQNLAGMETKVNEIKNDLASAYRDAKMETGNEWREIEVDFGNLTNDIRNKSVSAISKLRDLIDRLVNVE